MSETTSTQIREMVKRKEEEQVDKVAMNRLAYYALKYSNYPTDDAEIQKINMTDVFYMEIDNSLINRDPINWNVNGKPGSGKSTIGICLGKTIHQRGQYLKAIPMTDKFDITKIARTQQEADKLYRDPNIHHTVIVTDELSSADETGENITIIQAVREQVSNVHAQRFVHKISISPKEVTDVNADVFLEVIAPDRKRQITRCWLYYNLFKNGMDNRIFLGYVDVYVGELIRNYRKWGIDKILLNPNRTQEDMEILQEARKKDMYVDYVARKFEKMEVMTKEKIIRERDLDYAELIMAVVDELRDLAKLRCINKELVKSYVKIHARRLDLPHNIVGTAENTDKAIAILQMWETYFSTLEKIKTLENALEKQKITPEAYLVRHPILKRSLDTLQQGIGTLEDEYKRLIEINKKYKKTEGQGAE